MAGDLGAPSPEVHASARQLLEFWFEELTPAQHFAKDSHLDAKLSTRFGAMRAKLLRERARGWRDHPVTLLAAVILLDQVSRNIHRDRAEAFSGDALAQELTTQAMLRGWDVTMRPDRRLFLYMPLMHAESLEMQALSMYNFEVLGIPEQIRYAREHFAVIERFGRFPSRNAALGRVSTPEEEEYLKQPGAGW